MTQHTEHTTKPLIRSDFAPWQLQIDECEQLALPIGPDLEQEVHWYHTTPPVEQASEGFDRLSAMLGVAATHDASVDIFQGVVQKSVIDTADIDTLTDPDLRYALRLAAAARSLGVFENPDGYMTRHRVTVLATNEDVDSQLIVARYSGGDGDEDTFMRDLETAQPQMH